MIRYKYLLSVLLFICLVAFKPAEKPQGTNLKGRVLTMNSYRQYVPMAGARVTLQSYNNSQQLADIASTQTDANGFYYFTNIPVNAYTIKVAQPSQIRQTGQSKSFNYKVVTMLTRPGMYQEIPQFYF